MLGHMLVLSGTSVSESALLRLELLPVMFFNCCCFNLLEFEMNAFETKDKSQVERRDCTVTQLKPVSGST